MRIWIQGEPCYDQEPIQAYIMDLEKQLAEARKVLSEVTEAIMLLRQFRALYRVSGGFAVEPARSKCEYLVKQCEEGLRICKERRKDEYIQELHQQLAEKDEQIRQLQENGCFTADETGHKCQLAVKNEVLKKRITELESWLKPFHGTAEDVKGYEVYNLNPDTPSGLPMIPAEEKKE